MGLSHAPRVITDGIVLGLDAANTRSYVGSGTTWTDLIGSNNGTLTNGPVFTQEPKLEPFGGAGAVEFGGSADGLYTPNITLGSNDWTLEFWIYLTSTGTARGLYSYFLNTTTARSISCYIDSSNQIVLRHRINDGTYPTATGSTALSAHTWYHVAAVRVNDDYYIYINGVQDASYTSAPAGHTYYADGVPHYIGYNRNATSDFDGLLSNVRLVNGTALYTSNFTPPRKKLEVTSDTVLLTCEKGTIKDRSSSAHAITINGDAKSISGASYFEFDGVNDCVEVARSDDFDFGTGNLTIESWVYINEYNGEGNMLVYKTQSSSSAGSACGNYVASNGLLYMNASDNTTYQVNVSGGTVTLGRWHHICMTRVGSTWTCYLNTTQVSTATWAGSVSHVTTGTFGGIGMGAYTSAYGGNTGRYSMNGKISDVKIYKNKGLTASEVEQNYNALRGRYGI